MVLSKTFQQDTKWFLTELARFTFYIGLASYFVFLFIERRVIGLVSDYIDLRWVLGLSLVLGLSAIFWGTRARDEHSKWFIIEISKTIFPVALITYLVFFLLEDLLPGLISDYINLNILLGICAGSGILSIFAKEEKIKKPAITKKDYAFIVLLALTGTIIIWWKTKDLGWLSWVISVISGVLIVIISILLLREED